MDFLNHLVITKIVIIKEIQIFSKFLFKKAAVLLFPRNLAFNNLKIIMKLYNKLANQIKFSNFNK